uniref:Apple domain-containing protein n=1 Tax=Panagrellus redivivus TaxID=6233 RepID=A0A7E4W4L0_PANRE
MHVLLTSLFLVATVNSYEYEFIQTFGYDFSVHYFKTYVTINASACIDECIQYEKCIGIYMDRSAGSCLLIDRYVEYFEIPEVCSNYVLKTPHVDYPNGTLNDVEQLLYNLIYAFNGTCPNGWNEESTTCSLSFKNRGEILCDDYSYSPLPETSWNGTHCLTDKRF